MKKILMALLIMIAAKLPLKAQTMNIARLSGSWISADGSGLEVKDSSKIFLIYGTRKKAITSCQADFSKSPCWFDFTVDDNGKPLHIKSLLLMVNEDLIQWQIFDDESRPTHFSSEKGDMVYLRREKDHH